jgi:hypothetical protein
MLRTGSFNSLQDGSSLLANTHHTNQKLWDVAFSSRSLSIIESYIYLYGMYPREAFAGEQMFTIVFFPFLDRHKND